MGEWKRKEKRYYFTVILYKYMYIQYTHRLYSIHNVFVHSTYIWWMSVSYWIHESLIASICCLPHKYEWCLFCTFSLNMYLHANLLHSLIFFSQTIFLIFLVTVTVQQYVLVRSDMCNRRKYTNNEKELLSPFYFFLGG